MTRHRWVLLGGGLALLVFAGLLTWQVGPGWQYGMAGTRDFIEYWTAGQLLLQGRNPYDRAALLQLQRALGWAKERPLVMWNPPWLLIVLLPWLLLPFGLAAFAWLFLSLAVVVACGLVIWRECIASAARPWQVVVLIVATLLFVPSLIAVALGQMSLLLLLSVVGFMWASRRGRWVLAGSFLALSTIKPHVLYLLWLLVAWEVLVWRRWQVVLGVGWPLAGAALGLWLLRPQWVVDYLAAFRQPPLKWQTPTLGGALRAWSPVNPDWLQFAPTLLVLIVVVGYLIAARPRRFDWPRLVSPVVLLSVPTAPYGWSFDQVVLLIPFIELLAWVLTGDPTQRRSRWLCLAGLLGVMWIMLWQEVTWGNDLYAFWVPWALMLLYLWNRQYLCPARSAALAIEHAQVKT